TLSLMRYHATDSLTVQHADSLAVQHADSSVVPKKEAVKTGSPSVGTKNTQSPAVRVRDERILKPIEHGGEIQRTPQQ
ncbi:MAG: hypothetical protein LBL97_06640, partial [Prevotellaceae bacterium]|nr:hypothetical protein [Prevotellaceae bacterium]